jgi:hypothetical protein
MKREPAEFPIPVFVMERDKTARLRYVGHRNQWVRAYDPDRFHASVFQTPKQFHRRQARLGGNFTTAPEVGDFATIFPTV